MNRPCRSLRGKILCACLFVLAAPWLPPAPLAAQSWLDEIAREFESLRMRQLQTVQQNSDLAAFSTDGCSANLSANWKLLAKTMPGFAAQLGEQPPWQDCCVAHDRSYWQGGAVDGYNRRLRADRELRQCVVDTGARLRAELRERYSVSDEQVDTTFATIAELMFGAVRLGGQPCSLLPWRWGYGWPNCAFASISEIPERYANIAADENVVFFDTAAWFDAARQNWHIPIHAWVYENERRVLRKQALAAALESEFGLVPAAADEARFGRRTDLLFADNERDKRLVIRIAGRDLELPLTAPNGQVSTTLQLPAELVSAVAYRGRLHFFAVLQPGDERRFEGDVRLLQDAGPAVISDIDDTVKISGVTERRRLLENTFFREFEAVPGMARFYSGLGTRGADFFYVSSSPWQLYQPLRQFLHDAGFPPATLYLKAVRFRDESLLDLFAEGTATKPAQIEAVLQRFPRRRFILVGDSGEQDPEVYGDIARRYRERIDTILIRNVDASDAGDARYREAFRELERSRWQLFDDAARLDADRLRVAQ